MLLTWVGGDQMPCLGDSPILCLLSQPRYPQSPPLTLRGVLVWKTHDKFGGYCWGTGSGELCVMCGFQEGATGPREVDTRGRQLAVLGGRSPGWARLADRAKTCLAESQAETCRLGRVPSRALVEPFLACTQPGPPLSLPLSTQWSTEPCPLCLLSSTSAWASPC